MAGSDLDVSQIHAHGLAANDHRRRTPRTAPASNRLTPPHLRQMRISGHMVAMHKHSSRTIGCQGYPGGLWFSGWAA